MFKHFTVISFILKLKLRLIEKRKTSVYERKMVSEDSKPIQIKTKQIILKRISDLVETSSIHGLPNIVRTRRILIKIIWSLAFLASFSYAIISIINVVDDYLSYSVVVKMELVQDYNQEFPQVTVCNNNPVDFSNGEAVRTIERFMNNITSTTDNYFSFKNQTISSSDSACDPSLRQLLQRSFYQFNFTLDKMLIKCLYDEKPCTRDDFYPIRSGLFGVCYSFNSGKYYNGSKAPIKMLKRNGLLNGLRLQLFVGAREYLPCWLNENAAVLVIHNRTTNPLFIEESIKAPVGMETNIVVKNLKINKLPFPYSGCIKDLYSESSFSSNSYKNTVKTYGLYTQKWCILNCGLDLTLKENARKCSSNNQRCLNDLSNLANFYASCLKECPIECETNYFNVHEHFAKYPSFSYAEHLLSRDDVKTKFPYSSPTMSQLSDSVLSVNVYYDSPLYQKITETPETNSLTLISNIGGNLGLFIGISLLSFVEIIEIVLEMAFMIFRG